MFILVGIILEYLVSTRAALDSQDEEGSGGEGEFRGVSLFPLPTSMHLRVPDDDLNKPNSNTVG